MIKICTKCGQTLTQDNINQAFQTLCKLNSDQIKIITQTLLDTKKRSKGVNPENLSVCRPCLNIIIKETLET